MPAHIGLYISKIRVRREKREERREKIEESREKREERRVKSKERRDKRFLMIFCALSERFFEKNGIPLRIRSRSQTLQMRYEKCTLPTCGPTWFAS